MTLPPGKLRLKGAVRLTEAEPLRERLHDGLQKRDVIVDLGEADEVDASVLQVLVSARRFAEAEGRSFTVNIVPETQPAALIDRLHLASALGLSDHLSS